MIKLLIFSKDRACQLDLLLRSIEKYSNNQFNITILYTYSNERFENGYNKVKSLHNVEFIKEQNFRLDAISIVNCKESNVAFSTDDMVFYSHVNKIPHVNIGEVFSLRYGFNTTLQYYVTGQKQPSLNKFFIEEGIVSWNPFLYNYPDNYAYNIFIDLGVYNKTQLLDLISRFAWKNTNELEGGLQNYRNEITVIKSFQQSVAFNLCVNNLSGYTVGGVKHGFTTNQLNDLFLEGRTINVDMTNVEVDFCHNELPIVIKEVESGSI